MNEPNNPRRRTGANQPSTGHPATRDSHARSSNTRSSRSPSSPSSSSQDRRRRPPPPSQSLNWRSLLMVALVCALTGFVVIFVYEWYKKNERIETIRAFEQEQAVKKEAIIQSALFAERLRDTIMRASRAKTFIAEHYAAYGVFPSNVFQLGMMPEEFVPSEWAEDIKIEEGGTVSFVFSSQLGDTKGTIRLTPSIHNSAISWACTTADYPQMAVIVPGCIYVASVVGKNSSISQPRPVSDNRSSVTISPRAHDLSTKTRQAVAVGEYTYIEPTNGPKAGLRVSGGYFTGTPNLLCTQGFRGHPDELKKMLEDAGPDVKLAPFVDEFGVLLGTDYRPGYKGRKIDIPASDLNTQEPQAEVYIAAGKPFTLGFSADTKQGTVCGSSLTFTPLVNKNYEAVGEITQNEEGEIVGCRMGIYEISNGASKSVDTQGQCLGPASFSRILGK